MNLSAILNNFDTNVNNLSDAYEDDRSTKRRKLTHATSYQYREADSLSSQTPPLNVTRDGLGNGSSHTIIAHHDTTINVRDQYFPASPGRCQSSNDCGRARAIGVEVFSYSQLVITRIESDRCEDYSRPGTIEEFTSESDAATHCEEDQNVTRDFEEHICYGMLCNIDVEGCTVKKHGRFAVTTNGTCPLQLVDSAYSAGQLSRRAQSVLNTLVDEAGIRCQFWLHCGSEDVQFMSRSVHGRQHTDTKYKHTLSAILYGPESLANTLGGWLTEVGMFLQQPEDCDCNVPYKNPHCLSFGQSPSIMTGVFTTIDPTTQLKDEITSAGDLAELYTDEVYPEAPQPFLIRSPLHDYQKRALMFMLGREQGWCYDGPRSDIWQHTTDSFGRIRFKNTISGQIQKHPPNDFRGGILADDMGLGKTCTMLSLIATDPAVPIIRDAPTPTGSSLGSSSATLIVVPFSLLQVWEKQIQLHFQPNKIRYLLYHDLSRQIRTGLKFQDYDIVVSTYNTVASERKSCRKDTPPKGLFSVHWHRLILDEAHVIRTWTTANAKSVCDLEADCRWAVTGTPIQNRLSDIYSILKFLRVYPYENLKTFDDEILKPWKFNADQNALHRLQYLMKSIAIRRPKKTLSLPELQSADRHLELNADERSIYEGVRDTTIDAINSALSSQQQSGVSFINAFQKLNDLRYICNHGRAPTKRWKGVPNSRDPLLKDAVLAEELDVLLGDTGLICVHCGVDIQDQQEEYQSRLSNPASRGSRSLDVCRNCEAEAGYLSGTMSPCSPVSSPHTTDTDMFSSPSLTTNTVYSSKISALVDEVRLLPDNDKCVIFSYWTATLGVIGQALEEVGIVACQFDGRLSRAKRNQILYSFSTNPNIQVLLTSITCGGAGLDLTVANHAFLVEPQWNPQLEEQAMARVHRLGQTKPVRLIRFIVKDTWEEKIRHLQERKRSLADLIVDRKSVQDGDAGRKQLYYLRELLSNK